MTDPSTSQTIKEEHWDQIVTAIHEQRCVPFLGAGVNASVGDYQGLPLGGEVAVLLLKGLLGPQMPAVETLVEIPDGPLRGRYKDLAVLKLWDLARVALHVQVTNDNEHLMSRLRRILPDEHCEPSRLLQTLAKLPLELIVTTNYDRLMERALEQVGKPPPLVVGPPIRGSWSKKPTREHTMLEKRLNDHEGLILYKIHGSLGELEVPRQPADGRSPVIISEEDYIEFLTVAPLDIVGVPKAISQRLSRSVLLFLGYGLEDWDFRAIYKVLIEERFRPDHRRRSFAIQKNPSEFWIEYWARKNVTIYDVDLHDFAVELEQQYAARIG